MMIKVVFGVIVVMLGTEMLSREYSKKKREGSRSDPMEICKWERYWTNY